jgi:hypothetical protein
MSKGACGGGRNGSDGRGKNVSRWWLAPHLLGFLTVVAREGARGGGQRQPAPTTTASFLLVVRSTRGVDIGGLLDDHGGGEPHRVLVGKNLPMPHHVVLPVARHWYRATRSSTHSWCAIGMCTYQCSTTRLYH